MNASIPTTFGLALCLMAASPTAAIPVPGLAQQIPTTEYTALVDFYTAFQGPTWVDNQGWNDPAAPAWFGVTVSGFQYNGQTGDTLNVGHVTGISLADNGLQGSFPASITQLVNLQSLELSYNGLSGSIPADLDRLVDLEDIGLFGNELSGNIPESLGNLANLQSLVVSGNRFSGTIPEKLGKLANLQELDLSGNQLTGVIPESLGDLANLTRLDLSANQLSGSIPEALGKLAHLEMLYLSENQLSGSLPEALGNASSLQWFFGDNNQLSGSIPQSFGNLVNLLWLDLDGNQLSGGIPESFGNLVSLEWVRLDHNQLSGIIPASLGNLGNLTFANFDHNQISGSIPQSFTSLSKLQELYVSQNRLSGSIPDLSILADLGELDITYNCFDLSSGSEVSSIVQKLLEAGKRVEDQPQNTDCATVTLICPANVTTTADGAQTTVLYSTPTSSGGTGNVAVVCEPPSGTAFPAGMTTVDCVATDAGNAQASCSFSVDVQDTEPPVIGQIAATPTVLWPPNHLMIPVKISVISSDNCSPTTSKIVAISDSDPDDGSRPDWQVTGDLSLNLRAERSAKTASRIYSVTIESRDASGNSTQAIFRMSVAPRTEPAPAK